MMDDVLTMTRGEDLRLGDTIRKYADYRVVDFGYCDGNVEVIVTNDDGVKSTMTFEYNERVWILDDRPVREGE